MKKSTKAAKPRVRNAKPKALVSHDSPSVPAIQNSFSDAFLSGIGGFGPNQGVAPWQTTPVSSVTPMEKNLRWYLVSNFRQFLNQAYVEWGLMRTMIDVPVDDAFRGGIEIKSKQAGAKAIDKILIELERNNDMGILAQTAKWNRLFGGAGDVIVTGQNPETPLNVEAIHKKDLAFRATDMWELFWNQQQVEGFEEPWHDDYTFEYYSFYGTDLHKSRVLPMKGITAPSFIRPRLRGWGFSVVESVVRSLNQYLKATDLSYEVLDEFKIDVFRVKNLVNTLLGSCGSQKVMQRFAETNLLKNYQNAIVMDSEDEYQQKQLSFAGLSDVQKEIRMQVACELRMPMSKLFGIAAQGFGSGEDDLENYNAMVESEIRQKVKYHALRVVELRFMQHFGFIPDDMVIDFPSLRVMTAEQEENVKNSQFNRIFQTVSAGLMLPEEFKNACNKNELLVIQVDATVDQLDMGEDENESSEEGSADDEEKEDSGGANKPDNQKAATPVTAKAPKKSTLTPKDAKS